MSMNMKGKTARLGVFLALVLAAMVVINALSYKQVECRYRPDSRYISIELDNGILTKGIRFVSDGVIFEPPLYIMTAADYADFTRIAYNRDGDGMGFLSLSMLFVESGKRMAEKVGYIDETCWGNLKAHLAAHPEGRDIEIVE